MEGENILDAEAQRDLHAKLMGTGRKVPQRIRDMTTDEREDVIYRLWKGNKFSGPILPQLKNMLTRALGRRGENA